MFIICSTFSGVLSNSTYSINHLSIFGTDSILNSIFSFFGFTGLVGENSTMFVVEKNSFIEKPYIYTVKYRTHDLTYEVLTTVLSSVDFVQLRPWHQVCQYQIFPLYGALGLVFFVLPVFIFAPLIFHSIFEMIRKR